MEATLEQYKETVLTQYEPAISLNNLRVCYLDNEPSHLKELRRAVPPQTFRKLHLTTNFQDVIRLIKVDMLDVLISDFRMPEQNGIEFLSYCRRVKPELLLVLYTGFTLSDEEHEACRKNKIILGAKINSIENLIGNISLWANEIQDFENDNFAARIHQERVRPLPTPVQGNSVPVFTPAPLEDSKQILADVALRLIEKYRRMPNPAQAVLFIAPGEEITVEELIQDLEHLTPRGLRHLNLWIQSNLFVRGESNQKNHSKTF